MTYDDWKLRSPDDQYEIDHPEKFRSGVYRVTVTRTMEMMTEINVEATSEDDARSDAISQAKTVPFGKWEITQNDYDADGDVEGPDDARDEEYDR